MRSRLLLCALLLTLGAAPALSDELPAWPHEQQAMLRDVEDQLLRVQHQLFKARQLHDQPAIQQYGTEFRELQEKRAKLLHLTDGQLPSE